MYNEEDLARYQDLMKRQNEANEKQKMRSMIAGIADTLSSGNSAGNYWLGQRNNPSRAVSSMVDRAGKTDVMGDEAKKMAFLNNMGENRKMQQMGDPGSELSAKQREMYSQLLPGADLSKYSAKQLKTVAPVLFGRMEKEGDRNFQRQMKQEERNYKSKENEAKSKQKKLEGLTDTELKLQQRWQNDKLTKDTQQVAVSYEKVKNTSDNAAGDLALIFNYMKMLDPGSTVREGEFANAENSGSVPERVRAQYNKLMSEDGMRLAGTQRERFKTEAEKLFGSQMAQQKRFNDAFRKITKGFDANPERVIMEDLFKVESYKDSKSPKDDERMQAIEFVRNNPNDPKAQRIKQVLGLSDSEVAGQ